MNAILPALPLTNRERRRLYQQEALKCIEVLEGINTSFLYHLFNDPSVEYIKLYNEYKQKWEEAVNDLATKRKLKFVMLDLTWFENNYDPAQKNAPY